MSKGKFGAGMPIEERFLSHVEAGPNGCLLWTGCKTKGGYGVFSYGGHKSIRIVAHRWFYEYKNGPIPEGLQLDHLCRITSCVNPDHLEPVTPRENILRGTGYSAQSARKTHCPKGHPYDAINTYIKPNGNRACRACIRIRKYGSPEPIEMKTHCKHGHEFTSVNTRTTSGYRRCLICEKSRNAKRIRIKTGHKKGLENPCATFSLGQAIEIRKLYLTGNYTYRKLAREFNSNHHTIKRVVDEWGKVD